MWEAIFLLVVLKIPVVLVLLVVWWAIRAEPQREEFAEPARVPDTPLSPAPEPLLRTGWRGGRNGPERRPQLTPHRRVRARASVR